jgi:hypothetical protein
VDRKGDVSERDGQVKGGRVPLDLTRQQLDFRRVIKPPYDQLVERGIEERGKGTYLQGDDGRLKEEEGQGFAFYPVRGTNAEIGTLRVSI